MSSIIKVDTVQDIDGNNIINENADVITVGASGDTMTIPAGATFDSSAATNTLPSTVVTTTGTQTLTNKSIATTQLTGTITPSDSTVTTAKIVDANVTTAKIADANITLAKLSATGTQDATTFLRGDNTFATPTDNGKVLQTIHGSTTTAVTSSSSTEVTTGITAQITPSSTSNKILVFGSVNGVQIGTAASTAGNWKIRRHDTLTSAPSGTLIQDIVPYGGKDNASSDTQYALSFNDLDSPSTTDARNYTITFNRSLGSGSVQVQNNGATSSITLMEIQA